MRRTSASTNLAFIVFAMLMGKSVAQNYGYCFTASATSQQMQLGCQELTLAKELVVNMTDSGIVHRIGDDISDRDCPPDPLSRKSFGHGKIAGTLCDLFYKEENATEPDSTVVAYLTAQVPKTGNTAEDGLAIFGIAMAALYGIALAIALAQKFCDQNSARARNDYAPV